MDAAEQRAIALEAALKSTAGSYQSTEEIISTAQKYLSFLCGSSPAK